MTNQVDGMQSSERCKLATRIYSLQRTDHPSVCAADADIVFLSSDSILFRVHSSNLTCGSEGFAPPTGTSSLSKHDTVQLTETSMTLELLFQFMYPQRPPDLSAMEFKSFMGVAEAAEKYQVYSAMQICAMQMECVWLLVNNF